MGASQMPEIRLINDDNFAVVDTVLTADVAHNGTFTVGYPIGYAQNDFTDGLAVPNRHILIVNGNDRWTSAASNFSLAFGASLVTVTNTSNVTWTAGSRITMLMDIRDGNLIEVLQFSYNLAAITGNIDILTGMRLGIDATIEAFDAHVTTPVTTASRLATLTPRINATVLTGGAIALTSANCTPLGARIAGSAITANNRLTRSSALGIVASGVTAFAEGQVMLMMRIRRTPNLLT
jgi:hypothetical protein